MSWANEVVRGLAALLAAGVLAGCGGGGGGATPEPTALPDATGFVPGGAVVYGAQVTVRGTRGLGRIVIVREDGSFRASRYLLEGPYVVNAPVFDEATGTMLDTYAWSADAQDVSVNTLSSLQLAVLAKQDPKAVYGAISQWHDVQFSAAQMAAAEDEVADYLQRYLGVTVPAEVRGFTTATWLTGSGDPFETTIKAVLAAALARGEDLGTLAARLGRRSAACARQGMPVTVDGIARRFCPATLSRGADPEGGGERLRLDGDEDGVLEVRLNGGAVTSITHTLPDGRDFGCSGAGCAGASLRADGRLTLQLALPALDGSAPATQWRGSLSVPTGSDSVLPPAECRSQRVTVGGAGVSPQAECAASDDYGQGASFSSPRGYSPHRHADISLPASFRLLNLSISGRQVDAIVMSEFDATAGRTRYYACRGEACTGTTADTPADDPLDVGWQIQTLQLAGTRLARVRDDGTLDAGQTRTLDAQLRLIIDPALSQNLPSDCTGRPTIAVQVDEDDTDYGVCPAADDVSAATIYLEADGVTRQLYARSDNFESVTVFVDATDRVLRAVLDTNNGQRFGCGRSAAGEPACRGIALAAADAGGRRSLSFSGTTMRELVYGDFVGTDRTAKLSGQVTLLPQPQRAAGAAGPT